MDKTLHRRSRPRSQYLLAFGAVLLLGIAGHQVLSPTAATNGARESYVVVEGSRTRTIGGRATLIPTRITAVSSGVDGVVMEIAASPGEEMAPGQTVARLANQNVVTALRRAELAYQSAEATEQIARAELNEQVLNRKISVGIAERALATAEAELKAYQRLYDKGGVSRISLEKIEASRAEAVANLAYASQKLAEFTSSVPARRSEAASSVDAALQELQQAEANVKALTITAPNGGVLSKLDLTLGQRLASGAVVGEVISKELHADVEVSQDEASALSIGQTVTLLAPRGVLKAKISAVLPRATDGAVHAKAILLTEAPWARADLVCEALVEDIEATNGLFIRAPKGAFANSTATALVVDSDGNQKEVAVEFGDRFQEELLVKRGLELGDRVLEVIQ